MTIHKTYFKNYFTKISDNTLFFYDLTRPRALPEFIFSLNRLIKKFGHKDIVLNFDNAGYVYAYPITAIAGILHYYISKNNINFTIESSNNFYHKLGIIEPYTVRHESYDNFNKIWIYNNSDEVNIIISKIMKSIRRNLPCEIGVLDTCEWGLNEILDNVIQHSEIKKGFVMSTGNPTNKTLNICVFDYGIGIYNSLSGSKYKPKNDTDAITLAIKEGVTSGAGQGYGLAGLMKIIHENDGGLTIISGRGGIKYQKCNQKVFNFRDIILFDKNCPSTTVNFYLKSDNKVSVEKTVGKHYVNIELENMENEKDEIVFKIKEKTLGTATRLEAKKIRNEILNIFNATKRIIIIDFSDIAIISSSFADELIAELISIFGFCQFQKVFKIKNTNIPIQSIIDKAIENRILKNVNNEE